MTSSSTSREGLGDRSATASLGAAAHTLGPWDWDSGIVPPDGPERYADIYADGGDLIIASFNAAIPEGIANARLIAAAPDLLEALKRYLNCDQAREVEGDTPAAQARAAIAKAEGRSPSIKEDQQ